MDTNDRIGLPSSPRICISGWYGADNTGDEAILLQFIHEMVASREAHLTIFAADPKRAYALHARPMIVVRDHLRLFGRGTLRDLLGGRIAEQIQALRSCDLFVLGGGSLIHDRSSLSNLIHVLDEIWIAKILGRRVATYAIGVGPLRRGSARWLVAKTLSACDLVTVRDHGSKRLVVEMGVPEAKVHVVADPALLLKPVPLHPMRLPQLTDRHTSLKESSIGVFLVDDLDVDESIKKRLALELAKAFDALHVEFGVNFIFVPMMSQKGDDDRVIAHAVVRDMEYGSATLIVETIFSPDEVFWLAGLFRVNVALRLHALLFSLSQETPAVAISHDPKISNAMEEFGLEHFCVALDETTGARVQSKLAELLRDPQAYLTKLRAVLPERRSAARRTFELMKSLLTDSPPIDGGQQRIRSE